MKTKEMTKKTAIRKINPTEIRQLHVRDFARYNIIDLLPLLTPLLRRTWSPWAILLVRFRDDTAPLPRLTKYQRLFTSAGTGSLNMVDFFLDMSHGRIDVSGSQVFGWYTLPANRADYVGNVYPQPDGKLNRNGYLDLAKATATAAGVNLGNFAGVVVCGLGTVDLCGWIGGMAALCDSNSLSPSALGQEMGHGYGLDHARFQGSTADYQDPWDVMSTAAYPWMQAPHREYTTIGPGLNAWSMRSRNWLDESRVWKAPAESWNQTIDLRPLHRRDLPGFLAAQIGPFLVEFRMPERWDAAIPRAAVLVHRFEDNHSYLMPSCSGSQDIVVGDKFMIGDPGMPFLAYYAAEVVAIDTASQRATIHLEQRAAVLFPRPDKDFIGRIFGGVDVDGGGFIYIGGKVRPIPPRGPELELVGQVAQYLELQTAATGVGRTLAQRQEVLAEVIRAALQLYANTEVVSEHPLVSVREVNGHTH